MLAGFCEQEQWGEENGTDVAAVYFLAIFQRVNALMGISEGLGLGFETKGGGAGGDEAAIGLVSDWRRAADVLRASAYATGAEADCRRQDYEALHT